MRYGYKEYSLIKRMVWDSGFEFESNDEYEDFIKILVEELNI